jgi:hypothetical protein
VQFARAQLSQQKVEGAEHQAQYAELQERLVKAEQKVQEGELLRRKLHNTILVYFPYFQLLDLDLSSYETCALCSSPYASL